jgi:hypothetical protein
VIPKFPGVPFGIAVRPDTFNAMTFTLNIAIAAQDVTTIWEAGQSVTLVRPTFKEVGMKSVPSQAIVAWLAFQPFQSNQISWSGTGNVYASTCPLQAGNQITPNALCATDAQISFLYTLENGTFSATPHAGPYLYVENQMASPAFNFGIVQKATVNSADSASAVNALAILFNEQAYFVPSNTIQIFLSSCRTGGTILQQVAENALTIQLTEENPAANVGFDGSTFFLNPSGQSRAG